MNAPVPHRPLHVVVMGVTGTGKSTVAEALAAELELVLAEGDDFHPAANVAKMSAGIPLTDDDRYPWLEKLAEWTAEQHRMGRSTVLTCSALRRRYRDILRGAVPDEPTPFLHLSGTAEVLRERMRARVHFMPPSLLASQLDTLEPLESDEAGLLIDNDAPLADVIAEALAWLRGNVSWGQFRRSIVQSGNHGPPQPGGPV